MADVHELADTLSDEDLATILRIRIERYENMLRELTGEGKKAPEKRSTSSAPQKRRGRKPGTKTKTGKPGRPKGSKNKKQASQSDEE